MANTKVTSGVIKDDAVGADQLASNSVVTASIVDNAITTAKINNDAILTAKISDNAVTNAKLSSNSVDSDQYVDASIDTAHIRDGQITSAKLDTNISVSGELTVGSHLNMGDGDILKMGASADLQIYHDGSHSYIDELLTGDLRIRSNSAVALLKSSDNADMLVAIPDGAVTLYYAGSAKIATTSSGINVTGTAVTDGLTATGVIVTEGDAAVNDAQIGRLNFTNTNSNASANPIRASILAGRQNSAWGGYLSLYTSTGTSAASEKVRITETGNVGIGTSSPAQKLDIGSGYLNFSNNYGIRWGGATSVALYGNQTSNFLGFQTSSSEKMRIDSSGNVGIGRASIAQPSSGATTLAIQGTSTTKGGAIRLYSSDDSVAAYIYPDSTSGLSINTSTSHPMVFRTAGSERMRIDSSGNVGIGTSSPLALLDVAVLSSGARRLLVNYADSIITLQGANSSSTNETLRVTGDNLRFSTGSGTGTERMRIDASGHVVIQDDAVYTTNAPTYRGSLILAGASGATSFGGIEFHTNAGGGAGYGTKIAASDAVQTFLRRNNATGWSESMRIDSSGSLLVGKTASNVANIGQELRANGETFHTIASANNTLHVYSSTASAYRFYVSHAGQINATSTSINAISDKRLKENIVDLETGLSEVMSLQPRRFDWKNGDGENVAGFIAQEVETVLPDLISNYKHEELKDAKSVRMGDMIPTLVKAIQEQQAQIETLKAEIQELKG